METYGFKIEPSERTEEVICISQPSDMLGDHEIYLSIDEIPLIIKGLKRIIDGTKKA